MAVPWEHVRGSTTHSFKRIRERKYASCGSGATVKLTVELAELAEVAERSVSRRLGALLKISHGSFWECLAIL